jgi:hypothetical protein
MYSSSNLKVNLNYKPQRSNKIFTKLNGLKHDKLSNVSFLQETQKGIIGITVASHWFEPYSASIQDLDAAKRSLDFLYGWYVLQVLEFIYFSIDLTQMTTNCRIIFCCDFAGTWIQ